MASILSPNRETGEFPEKCPFDDVIMRALSRQYNLATSANAIKAVAYL